MARFHSAQDGDKDFSMADEMLQTALVNFPGVLLPLLDKCSIDAEDKVARHPFFVDSQRGQVEMTKRTKYQTFICTRGKSVKMSHVSYLGNGRSDQDFLHMLKTIGDLQLFEVW